MKKFVFIISFLSIFFIFTNFALASCTWRPLSVAIGNSQTGGDTDTTGGCLNNERKRSTSDTENCSGQQPNSQQGVESFTSYICCCGSDQVAAEKAALFTLPDFQVAIPGMAKMDDVTCGPDGRCEIPWLGQYIAGIYNYALAIAGILAALMLMAGGVIWLISGGDASKITQAKEIIIGSVTGLIILAASYVILIQINPELVNLGSITISNIKKMEIGLATTRYSTTAESYKNANCASDEELKNGINFYSTGYYKPAWEDSDKFRCVVAMQCSCPNGQDTTKNCDSLYGKTFPGYHPCNNFSATTPYCNMTSSGTVPKDGDIAGPNNCSNLKAGDKVCFKGKTYTITDSGGGIKGKRIDIWSGTDLEKAYSSTGVGTLKKGACQ
jgi:3D (Asp-Asp-Asp) domain-containing protein